MKFTLLFYTDNWETGPVVDLAHIPNAGSIIWTAGTGREDSTMYYVDNIMYPERGLDDEDTVYLYVRPYTGYSHFAPKTEADRIAERLDVAARKTEETTSALRTLRDDIRRLTDVATDTRNILEGLKHSLAADASHAADTRMQVLNCADSLEEGQQVQIEKLNDILLSIEQLAGNDD